MFFGVEDAITPLNRRVGTWRVKSSTRTNWTCWTDHRYGARGLGCICFGMREAGKAIAPGETHDLLELGRRIAFVSRSGCYEAGFRR